MRDKVYYELFPHAAHRIPLLSSQSRLYEI